jgi:hypothetical protein
MRPIVKTPAFAQFRNAGIQLKRFATVMLVSSVALVSCDKDDDDYDDKVPPVNDVKSTIVSGSGDISAQLTQFRTLLGDPVNGAPGQTTGRREINWDGVPPDLTNQNNFPFDFFNSTDPAIGNGRKRGLVYLNTNASFRVDTTAFSGIEASYAAEFKAFSPKRLFATIGTNITDVGFRLAGTNTEAFVRGFGLIFSDVDNASSTTLEFFAGNKSLGVFKAPARSDANGHSFLGVFFPEEKVTRVKITAGNGVMAAGVKDVSAGGNKDVVVMDDFFYDEPKPKN